MEELTIYKLNIHQKIKNRDVGVKIKYLKKYKLELRHNKKNTKKKIKQTDKLLKIMIF